MVEHSQRAAQAYAEFSRHAKGSNQGGFNTRGVVTKQDPEDDIDELAVVGGHTRLVKTSKDTPASSANHSVYSPSQRHLSPGITETSSQSDSSAFLHDRSPQWGTEFKHREDQSHGISGDPEYHVSSNGSVASGISPSWSVPAHYSKDIDHQTTILPKGTDFRPQEGASLRGARGYGYVLEDIQGSNESIPYDAGNARAIAVNGRDPYYVGQADNLPMDISADLRDWNFLDDWYGHIFSMDVIPPDYGKTLESS